MSFKIVLPFTVRPEHLTKVLGVLLRAEKTAQYLGQQRRKEERWDGNQPSSPSNDWYWDFKNEPRYTPWPGASLAEALGLKAQWPDGTALLWPFFQSSEYEEGKILMPDASWETVALCKRLCEVFGGYLSMGNSDVDMAGDVLMRVHPKHSLFPAKRPKQTPDERWYQFQNMLTTLPPLLVRDLERAQELCSSATPTPDLAQKIRTWEAQGRQDRLETVLSEVEEPLTRKPGPRL